MLALLALLCLRILAVIRRTPAMAVVGITSIETTTVSSAATAASASAVLSVMLGERRVCWTVRRGPAPVDRGAVGSLALRRHDLAWWVLRLAKKWLYHLRQSW